MHSLSLFDLYLRVEVADSAGNTALHMAAAGGHLGVVHALLARQERREEIKCAF